MPMHMTITAKTTNQKTSFGKPKIFSVTGAVVMIISSVVVVVVEVVVVVVVVEVVDVVVVVVVVVVRLHLNDPGLLMHRSLG